MSELRINSIESFSTKDGEGVRSVVFLQGCHLRCDYCHNPETWNMKGGEVVPIEDLTRRLLRFKEYWGERGGVTISGGEPLLQAKELIGFIKLLKQHNVNIAVDTSGTVSNRDARKVISLCDLVLLDMKKPNELPFLDVVEREKKRTWIRIVIVPGVNDTEEAIDNYAKILKGREIEKVELIPFHTLGFDKYEKLGIKNPLSGTKGMSVSRVRELQRYFERS